MLLEVKKELKISIEFSIQQALVGWPWYKHFDVIVGMELDISGKNM